MEGLSPSPPFRTLVATKFNPGERRHSTIKWWLGQGDCPWSFTIFQSPTPVTAPILRTWRHYWPFRRSTCDLQSSARLLLSRFLAQSGVGSREHRCSHCLRQLASLGGYPARSRHSSLRSHAENKIPPSAIPLGKTSGCRPSASYACKLSFLTRRTPASPRLKRLMRTDAKTLSVSPSDRV